MGGAGGENLGVKPTSAKPRGLSEVAPVQQPTFSKKLVGASVSTAVPVLYCCIQEDAPYCTPHAPLRPCRTGEVWQLLRLASSFVTSFFPCAAAPCAPVCVVYSTLPFACCDRPNPSTTDAAHPNLTERLVSITRAASSCSDSTLTKAISTHIASV